MQGFDNPRLRPVSFNDPPLKFEGELLTGRTSTLTHDRDFVVITTERRDVFFDPLEGHALVFETSIRRSIIKNILGSQVAPRP